MRSNLNHIEKYRIRSGPLGSNASLGRNGAFRVKVDGTTYNIVVSDKQGWEHVSAHVNGVGVTPTWEEMCTIKDLFWGADETVVQYHPGEREYVNNHPTTLHLWRPVGQELPVPPTYMVGVPGVSRETVGRIVRGLRGKEGV